MFLLVPYTAFSTEPQKSGNQSYVKLFSDVYPCSWKCGRQTNHISISGELVRDAEPQAQPRPPDASV